MTAARPEGRGIRCAPGGRSQMVRPDPKFPKELKGDNPFLFGDLLVNNQSQFNGAATKLRMLKDRHPGEAHPLDVGTNAVARYFKIEDECAQAVRLKVLAASGGLPQ